jgi:hypothetical protein
MSVPGGADSLKGSSVVLVVAVDIATKVVSTEKKSVEDLMSVQKTLRRYSRSLYFT